LKALGGDVCVLDGPDLAAAVKAQTREAPIRLGLDAVSGRATARLSACLADGGVVCNYGSMTGEDPVMSRSTLISGGQSLVGFILGRALGTRSLPEIRAIYADLARRESARVDVGVGGIRPQRVDERVELSSRDVLGRNGHDARVREGTGHGCGRGPEIRACLRPGGTVTQVRTKEHHDSTGHMLFTEMDVRLRHIAGTRRRGAHV